MPPWGKTFETKKPVTKPPPQLTENQQWMMSISSKLDDILRQLNAPKGKLTKKKQTKRKQTKRKPRKKKSKKKSKSKKSK